MKWPRARVWKCSAKARLTAAPPIAPTTGTAWAANFSPATTPKRAAIWAISRARSGAPFAGEAAPGEKPRAFGDRAGERRAHREIAALDRRFAGFAAEREDLEAGERALPAARYPRLLRARSGRSSASGSRSKPALDRGRDEDRTPRRSRPKPPPRPCGRRGRPWRATLWSIVLQRDGERGPAARARRRGRPSGAATGADCGRSFQRCGRAARRGGRRSRRRRGSARRKRVRRARRSTIGTA